MDYKTIAGGLAALLAIAAVVPYIFTIVHGKTRPHLFSWIIWVLLNIIAFSAQLAGGAGPGAWVTAASGIGATIICIMAWRHYHDISVNRTDWIAFGLALSAIPFWMLTDNPLIASIIVTLINFFAITPTVRKAWNNPASENLSSYTLHLLKCLAGIAAMIQYNPTTMLYPLALTIGNLVLICVISGRKITQSPP